MTAILIIVGLGAALSCLATRAVLSLLRRAAVLDHPNDRSSHVIPTPRGGGIAVIAAIVATALGAAMARGEPAGGMGVAMALAIGLAVVSFIDDLRNLSAGIRLTAHGVAVVGGLWALGGHGAFAAYLPQPLDLTLTALAWLWFINLYNFMDGIDGIVGSETAAIALGIGGLAVLGLAPASLLGPSAAILGAALGFLIWNWHRARIFLGDSGSIPIGFLVGYLLIDTAQPGGPALAAALVLPLVFVVDASVTLIRRLARGKKPTEAHREHAYQRAVQGGWPHDRVCGAVLAANALLIAIAWGLAAVNPWAALAAGLAVAALAYLLLMRVGRHAPRPA